MEYKYADELKKEFEVLGYFYDLLIDSAKEPIHCRSVLEIYRKKREHVFNTAMFAEEPNAVFIMMNPGSSRPRDKEYHIPKVTCNGLSKYLLEQHLIETRPDNTQYQVMRVMKDRGWDHVRVLNLSDIRESKSSKFVKKVQELKNSIHSVFSEHRKSELDKAINIEGKTPIVCAWGVNTKLRDSANLCLKGIPAERIVGISAENLYYHPLPSLVLKQIEWLENIMERLDDFNEGR